MKIKRIILILICWVMVLYAGKNMIQNRDIHINCSTVSNIDKPNDIDDVLPK